ncbi:ABC transporter ATP-binding protein [Bacillus sp. OK048]|uniref:ABC transporter ATP-binding protein n=1 Tax=Bacillus sp. OK048 TaxID=1882761 RepID=UPI00087EEF40|nr:ABC transporter ATP-binding protein [Bacillus sp. OK048]SDL92181.1 putative spermidine/putrescine transport system ATP-binding protein [Bacillus sp. OK048]
MQLENVTITINQARIINSLNLSINPGEIFVLMGPSGSGKTTILKSIAGLLPFSSGRISWAKGTGTTGLVFQEPRLFPHLTVLENIAFGLKVKGISAKERKIQARNFLKSLQLENLENRYPHQLSGGQQQRVSLGRALILNPDLLLLDEPFASLDTTLREDLISWLYALQRNLGFSILWVTHYIDEALSIADRIGVIFEGRLQQIGKPAEIFQQPSSEKIAHFLSLPNRFSKEQWESWFQSDLAIPSALNRGWIDSNHLQIIDEESEHTSKGIYCIISGVITKVNPNREGFTLTVESNSETLEVRTLGWKKVPVLKDNIKIKLLLEQIYWYTE